MSEFGIPVISINVGVDTAKEMGLMLHVGQLEYNAGYSGGKLLTEKGMSLGYCLHHIPGHDGLTERCRGFGAVMEDFESDSVQYGGMIHIPQDSDELLIWTIEEQVSKDVEPGNDNWDGVGLMILGWEALSGVLSVQERHPGVILAIFDVEDAITTYLKSGKILFAIDQQPFLQGSLPVYMLAYKAFSIQSIVNPAFDVCHHPPFT
jgi:simple sugar transport system substrate-binding protein